MRWSVPAPFDIFPTYEEWISHFQMGQEPDMGALATYHFGHLPCGWRATPISTARRCAMHEQHHLIDTENKVQVALVEENGKTVLKTNVYELLKGFKAGILCSETLGKAFEPEQRFENPDGTDITFNTDYFHQHREGCSTLPGPLAEGGDSITLW